MNDLQISEGREDLMTRFLAESVESLKAKLAECISYTAKGLMHMACLVRALEEKGEDMDGLKLGIMHHLRKIACGTLLPEVVLRFAGKPALIAVIGGLPLSEQKKLADGKPVRLVVYDPATRERTHRMADPLDMTPAQVRQTFARDHVRRDDEQLLLLDDRREKAMLPVPEMVGKMRIDRVKRGVTVGKSFVPLAELEMALKLLRE